MIISDDVLSESAKRYGDVQSGAATARLFGAESFGLTVPAAAEAKVSAALAAKRKANLLFGSGKSTPTEYERIMGTNDLVDEFYLERALLAARPVCRVVLRNSGGSEIGYASGFMVSPRLLLTNCHVFPSEADAANAIAEFDYTLDICGNPETSTRFLVDPGTFYLSDPDLDYALVAVKGLDLLGKRGLEGYRFHRLSADPYKIGDGEWMTIIQYPGGNRRQYAIRENNLIKTLPSFLWYKSDTAPGSSGSPVFNDSFQVVALHHSGKPKMDGNQYVLKDGSRVASIANIDDSKVEWEANEGVRISSLSENLAGGKYAGNEFVRELQSAAKQGDIMTRTLSKTDDSGAPEATLPQVPGGAGITINITNLTVSQLTVGAPASAISPAAAASVPAASLAAAASSPAGAADASLLEKLVTPTIDPDYSNRAGYDSGFLGTTVPLPEAIDDSVCAKMDNGECALPYEHFSIVIQKERRLALFTASNVDARAKSVRPEPGDYSRKGLTGLGAGDLEKWFTDPRIPEQCQLPDVFYNKDGQAFDKGHIVRRDDVCWGATRDEVVRGNGDTFHTTNCSPQVADFNRSAPNHGLWGMLENFIQKQAKAETYTLFAGPVLAADDVWFAGKDDRGDVKVQIPKRFWKVVVARAGADLHAYAFVLEQDLSKLPAAPAEEFVVNAAWQPYLVSIPALEKAIGNVRFPEVVRDADQCTQPNGDELLLASGISRRPS